MLEPNDLPLICLPMDLDDHAAAELVAFFRQISEALERHYAGQLLRQRQRQRRHNPEEPF